MLKVDTIRNHERSWFLIEDTLILVVSMATCNSGADEEDLEHTLLLVERSLMGRKQQITVTGGGPATGLVDIKKIRIGILFKCKS